MISHENEKLFGRSYFESGARIGISLYENYRWMPELSIPMACRLNAMFPKKSILDFGCAKGFLVKALRLFDTEAFGFDISTYAINEADQSIKKWVTNDFEAVPPVDVIFAKDTLEHVPKHEIAQTVDALRTKGKEALIIIPFGDDGKYRIPDYAKDLTHRIAENEDWWEKVFVSAGFQIDSLRYTLRGFKDRWANIPHGNGFYFLS